MVICLGRSVDTTGSGRCFTFWSSRSSTKRQRSAAVKRFALVSRLPFGATVFWSKPSVYHCRSCLPVCETTENLLPRHDGRRGSRCPTRQAISYFCLRPICCVSAAAVLTHCQLFTHQAVADSLSYKTWRLDPLCCIKSVGS